MLVAHQPDTYKTKIYYLCIQQTDWASWCRNARFDVQSVWLPDSTMTRAALGNPFISTCSFQLCLSRPVSDFHRESKYRLSKHSIAQTWAIWSMLLVSQWWFVGTHLFHWELNWFEAGSLHDPLHHKRMVPSAVMGWCRSFQGVTSFICLSPVFIAFSYAAHQTKPHPFSFQRLLRAGSEAIWKLNTVALQTSTIYAVWDCNAPQNIRELENEYLSAAL